MTNKNSIQQRICSIIDSSEHSVKIAMAWLTDEIIVNHLLTKVGSIKVVVLLSGDEVNLFRHLEFQSLISKDAKILKLGSNDALLGDFMHAKMIIIDDSRVFGGSYNATSNSKTNYDNFGEYVLEDAKSNLTRFDLWCSNSIDFFSDVQNPTEVIERLKEKYKNQKQQRESFLEALNIQLSEREHLIEKELIKDVLAKQASSLQNRAVGISKNGQLSNGSNVVKSEKHRFYGGQTLRTRYKSNISKGSYSKLMLHKLSLDDTYDFISSRIEQDTLISRGSFRTDSRNIYSFRIEYRVGDIPRVYITNKNITPNHDNHIYEDGCLCLFYPGDLKWTHNTSISKLTIPWIIEWILFCELYLITGKWGGEFVPHKTITPNIN